MAAITIIIAAQRGTRDGQGSSGPIPTKSTASVGVIGTAERAVTAEPKALEPWTGALAF